MAAVVPVAVPAAVPAALAPVASESVASAVASVPAASASAAAAGPVVAKSPADAADVAADAIAANDSLKEALDVAVMLAAASACPGLDVPTSAAVIEAITAASVACAKAVRDAVAATQQRTRAVDASAFLMKPAASWDEAELQKHMVRREGRVVELEPVCVDITHYRRVGRGAKYEFLCELRSAVIADDKPMAVWIKYLDLVQVPTGHAKLIELNWRMCAMNADFSDDEDVWNSDFDSCDEALMERRQRRGSVHPMADSKYKRKATAKRQRTK